MKLWEDAQQHTRNQVPSSGVDGGDVLVLQAIAQACLRDTKLTGEANVANESLEMEADGSWQIQYGRAFLQHQIQSLAKGS